MNCCQLLTLAHTWVTDLLPHCLGKINRVTYGLLKDGSRAEHGAISQSPSQRRDLAAVPFVGKDVPSTASEFAHPDIVIGLTSLAVCYEGLRRSDMKQLLEYLRKQHHSQPGPEKYRPERLKFQQWITTAQDYMASHSKPGPDVRHPFTIIFHRKKYHTHLANS